MRRLVAVFLFALSAPAIADSVERFQVFVRTTPSAQASFEQKVYDKAGKLVQSAAGTFSFQRPGRFRWAYAKPNPQLIVGDGTKVWIWDEDLNQVTVKALSKVLGETPAALLAGSNDIDRSFNLSSIGNQEGLDWLEAVPKAQEGTFQKVRIGFGQTGIEAMELRDAFGQVTIIRFSALERNPKLSPEVFRFTPPKGTDVISD